MIIKTTKAHRFERCGGIEEGKGGFIIKRHGKSLRQKMNLEYIIISFN